VDKDKFTFLTSYTVDGIQNCITRREVACIS